MADFTMTLNDKKVRQKITQIEKDMRNFRKPLKQIGDDLLDFYGDKVFKTEGKAIGANWPKLSPATLKLRAERRGSYKRSGGGKKTLIWTKNLQQGFKKTVTRTRLVIKNPVKYFKFHQKGGRGLPQRKMLSINSTAILIIRKGFNKFIQKSIKR